MQSRTERHHDTFDKLDFRIGKGDGGLFSGRNADGTFTPTDRQGGQSQFDEHGLVRSRQDRLGNATTFSYIDLNNDGVPDALSEMVEPGGRTTTFAYSGGRLQTITDSAGHVTFPVPASRPARPTRRAKCPGWTAITRAA
jgi:YD repeat-containing protein